jgi:magnesium chelatase family protein
MLVLACNPCPCGEYSQHAGANRCTCRAVQLRDYRNKMTGPIADRIDIVRHVGPLQPHEHDRFSVVEPSDAVRARVGAARERQLARFVGCGWRLNSQVPGPALRDRWPLSAGAQRVVDDALYAGRLSSRGAVRVQRLAWTVADLVSVRTEQEVQPGIDELDVALRLRQGDPLLARTVEAKAG